MRRGTNGKTVENPRNNLATANINKERRCSAEEKRPRHEPDMRGRGKRVVDRKERSLYRKGEGISTVRPLRRKKDLRTQREAKRHGMLEL